MARSKTETQIEQFTDADQTSQALEEIRQENNTVAAADAVIMGSFDAIKAIGRIETAQFYATVAEKLIAETAINLRQGKQYKGLPYQDENGNTRHVAHFDEFCQAYLGKSARRVQELVSNYNTLGPDLYEQAERIGFRQRDYNALKALPSDDRALIAQAIEEENLEKALDILQEMAAKHVREKEELTKQTADLTHTLEAKDKVIKDKTGVIDTQAERIALLETKQKSVSAEQRLLDLRSNLQIAAADIKADVMTRLRGSVKALMEQPGDNVAYAATCLIEIGKELAILRDEYDLPALVNESPLNDVWQAVLNEDAPPAPVWAAQFNTADSE